MPLVASLQAKTTNRLGPNLRACRPLVILPCRFLLGSFVCGDALLEELFVGVGESVAFGDVGSHGFEAAHVFVLVEAGEGFVLLHVEDQVGEGSERSLAVDRGRL